MGSYVRAKRGFMDLENRQCSTYILSTFPWNVIQNQELQSSGHGKGYIIQNGSPKLLHTEEKTGQQKLPKMDNGRKSSAPWSLSIELRLQEGILLNENMF